MEHKMTKTTTRPMVRIHNVETDEIIDREMNDTEFHQWQEDQAAQAETNAAANQKAIDKAEVLAQLGITEEQAKLLLG